MNDLLAGATGDCNSCPYWRRKGSKKKGARIPWGQFGWAFGKCIRPQGHCYPQKIKGTNSDAGNKKNTG